ncbi:MAG TPA: hypothetical protein PLJ71_21125 [Candidatus Hydrogenedentes bacterium]|nr:hypothetical protein [Candidatus Hydrogenedentota bacterium]
MSIFEKPGYQIDRPEPSQLFLKARNIAGLRLQEQFNKNNGCVEESRDYKWIKAELTCPSFDHLTFGYKNQVFSVLVDLRDSQQSYLSRQERDRFITATTENNLVPCLFPIMLPELKPAHAEWNLTHITTGKSVVPNEVATDENMPMSEWELHNFVIQIVRNHLEHDKRSRILSFCDILQINPQIWFDDAAGNTCWVLVRHLKQPEDGAISKWIGLEKLNPPLKGYDGFFAGVSLASSAPILHDQQGNLIPLSERFSGKAPLYRGDQFYIEFDGLQRIHVP